MRFSIGFYLSNMPITIPISFHLQHICMLVLHLYCRPFCLRRSMCAIDIRQNRLVAFTFQRVKIEEKKYKSSHNEENKSDETVTT